MFLDPDTGLALRTAGAQHVAVSELQRLWAALQPGDWLVLYQHARRRRGWAEEAAMGFKKALSVSRVETFRSSDVGRDVIFLAAQRHAA